MAFELKRKDFKFIPVTMNGETLKARLDDSLARWKAYSRAQNQLKVLADKANNLATSDEEMWSEFYELYGTCVISLMRVIFQESDVQKIIKFFDDDAAEAITQLMPFISGEYSKALAEERKIASRKKLEAI